MTFMRLKHCLMAAMITVVMTAAYSVWSGYFSSAAHATAQAATDTKAVAVAQQLPDMSGIVVRNGPAVVNVSISGTVKTSAVLPAFPQPDSKDPFYEFFRQFQIPQQNENMPIHGLGSGFIVSPDGVVLTNAHVVDGADEVIVKLTDKREFRAKVLGIDKPSDIAVLKIDAKDLPTVKTGSSSNTRVGEWVLAIGSPYGFENSATAGIVSAKFRSLPDDNYVPFIQTDVAVNPGNSGGPLFNMAGEVIGINSQIYSRNGGYQGLSFAIPIDIAMQVEQQIVAHGKVQRGRLGVSIQEVNQALAKSFGMKKPTGALISSVEAASPAAKAGLETGDVILSVNGKEITDSIELPPIIAGIHPGDTVTLQVWRKGNARSVDVKVGELTDTKIAKNDTSEAANGRLGLALRPLSKEEQRMIGVHAGFLVENATGPAARAGIRSGDVLLSINGESAQNIKQIQNLIAKSGKEVAVLIQRDNTKIFVPVDLG